MDDTTETEPTPRELIRADLLKLIPALIGDIEDDDRSDEEAEEPSMQVTIACNEECTEWNYQTGDNSFTGGAYGLPHWAVVYLTRDSDPTEIVDDVLNQWDELREDWPAEVPVPDLGAITPESDED